MNTKTARVEYRDRILYILNREIHRENAPAVVYTDGSMHWYKNDKRHRENGPAIIRNDGAMFWYKNGKLHREDGPARIFPDGEVDWFINGKEVIPTDENEISHF